MMQVYGHRMTCWEEHLGRLEDVFQQPHDVNCVRRVRALAAVHPPALTPYLALKSHFALTSSSILAAAKAVLSPETSVSMMHIVRYASGDG